MVFRNIPVELVGKFHSGADSRREFTLLYVRRPSSEATMQSWNLQGRNYRSIPSLAYSSERRGVLNLLVYRLNSRQPKGDDHTRAAYWAEDTVCTMQVSIVGYGQRANLLGEFVNGFNQAMSGQTAMSAYTRVLLRAERRKFKVL